MSAWKGVVEPWRSALNRAESPAAAAAEATAATTTRQDMVWFCVFVSYFGWSVERHFGHV
eukprot:m.332042 g.332042  ORF g.332042 m.332042 type:complete len:60 (-) comp16514_c1_seq15:1378-1557(-)